MNNFTLYYIYKSLNECVNPPGREAVDEGGGGGELEKRRSEVVMDREVREVI